MKRIVLATMAAAVVMFSLAGLYTSLLARAVIANYVDSAMLRPTPNLSLVFAGYALLALLMALIYTQTAHVNRSPAWSGTRFGLIAGICWLMPYSLVLFGVYRFPYVVLPMDFAWALIEQGTGGLVIGLILGRTVMPASARRA